MSMQLTVAFDGFLPVARWGPLFHVLCLEQPGLVLRWKPVGFPARGRSLLGDADVGLFLEPPAEEGLDTLVIESSPMVVVMAVGHPLAGPHEVSVAEVLDQPFPNWPGLDARWHTFWSLDEHRGGPPAFAGDVTTPAAATDLVAAGAAIATLPEWAASGLQHPGVVSVALRDGPTVTTRLVWRTGDKDPIVRALVELAAAWTALRDEGTVPGVPGQA
jgi:DNA-binding transcriptional LysR family regulator